MIKRKSAMVLFLACCIPFVLSAMDVSFSLFEGDSAAMNCRWKEIGSDSWHDVDANDQESMKVEYTHKGIQLFNIQISQDNVSWNDDQTLVVSDHDCVDLIWNWTENMLQTVNSWQWRLDGGPWNETTDNTFRQTFNESSSHTFEIRYLADGQWSEHHVSNVRLELVKPAKVKPAFESFVSIGPSTAAYNFYNGHNVSGANTLETCKLGLSADLSAGMTFGRHFRVSGFAGYSMQNKKETIIPDAFLVQYYQVGGACDLLVPFAESYRFFVGLSGAYSVDINGGYWSPSVFVGARLGADYFVNEHFFIGLKTSLRIAHDMVSDPMYSSYSYIVDPVSLVAGVRF